MIHIKVDNHALTAVSDQPLVAKTIGVAVFEAEFSPDWEDYEKTVVFSGRGGTRAVLYTGGVLTVPWEPMDRPGRLRISAVGLAEGKRDVTAMMASCLYVTENGDLGEDATESDPTLPPTEQAVLACAKSAREAREAAERAKAAVANPPKISDAGTWLVWDAESGDYMDTGIPVPTGGSTPGAGGIDVSGAEVGQTIKIAAVDDKGVPTAWEPVEFPSGGAGGDWELITDITLAEDTTYLDIENSKEYSQLAVTGDVVTGENTTGLTLFKFKGTGYGSNLIYNQVFESTKSSTFFIIYNTLPDAIVSISGAQTYGGQPMVLITKISSTTLRRNEIKPFTSVTFGAWSNGKAGYLKAGSRIRVFGMRR